MGKKHVFLVLSIVLLIIVVAVNFLGTGTSDAVVVSSHDRGVVDKAQGDSFTVQITFKNTGKTVGNWSVNVAFEADSWSWKGMSQNLTLAAGEVKNLSWNSAVPDNATLNSVARLVVYYNDSFMALDWWIHVVPGAELSIQSSRVL